MVVRKDAGTSHLWANDRFNIFPSHQKCNLQMMNADLAYKWLNNKCDVFIGFDGMS
jgi:hypothetical protein